MPGYHDCSIHPGYRCNIGVCTAEDEYWWSDGWYLSGEWRTHSMQALD